MTQFTDNTELQTGTNHLFVIGIDTYQNIGALQNCVNDAKAFVNILAEKYHFDPPSTLENPTNTHIFYDNDASLENIIHKLNTYTKLTEQDNLLIYFSGHGYLENNIGYIMPVDATKNKLHTFINNEAIISYLDASKAKHILLIADSCYAGSFLIRNREVSPPESKLLPALKIALSHKSRWVLSSGRLEPVSDGTKGKHSPFATHLLAYLDKEHTNEGFSTLHLTEYIQNNIKAKQTPIAQYWTEKEKIEVGKFVFIPKKIQTDKTDFDACNTKTDFEHFIHKHKNSPFIPQANAQIAAFLQTEAQELYDKIIAADWHEKPALCKQFRATYKEINKQLYKQVQQEGINADIYLAWQKVNKKSVFAIDAFLDQHENSFLDTEIKATLKQAEDASIAEDDRILAQKKQRLKEEAERKKREKEESEIKRLQEEAERKAKEDPFHDLMVKIPAGSFEMGSNEDSDSQPIHKVTLKAFEICKYQVTQKQWQMIMGENPSHFKGDDLPVEQVSSNDIQIFLQKLNIKTGKNYRLPSEAEWEYAARGGQNYKYAGSDNIDEVAWYRDENSEIKTHPVGKKNPNGYGLYDMTGNVWEWCQDKWHEYYKGAPNDGSAWLSGESSERVSRGSSFIYEAKYAPLTYRYYFELKYKSSYLGFRLCHA